MAKLLAESAPETTVVRSPNPCLTLLVLVGLLMAAGTLRSRPWGSSQRPVPAAVAAVDPNLAPWWELTVLPRIGETLARRIVNHRESAAPTSVGGPAYPVFASVNDLHAVRGIGPKTLQRIGPFLTFDTAVRN